MAPLRRHRVNPKPLSTLFNTSGISKDNP